MDIDVATIGTIVGAIAAALGGKEAWSYYKKKLSLKAKLKMNNNKDEAGLRDEIKGMLEEQIADLKKEIIKLTERIKHMEDEREGDKKRIAKQDTKIGILSERLTTKFKTRGKKGGPNEDISLN